MSTDDEDKEVSVCANCGKGEEESDKLKSCTACMMVKYCSRDCQIAHRPQHKKECRRRAAELHDEEVFKQPPPKDDCPICFLLLPRLRTGWQNQSCCGKVICSGCIHAPLYDDQGNIVAEKKCPFCRVPIPSSVEETIELERKRVEAGDAQAMYNIGCDYRDGTNGYPRDYTKALELWYRSGELGHAASYCNIGYSYSNGRGVERDIKKAKHYYELAAMSGDSMARNNLGANEVRAGNMERALKHYMIAVRGGESKSLEQIQKMYKLGHATKEYYTAALQAYQEYLSEIKSDQRDKAAADYEGDRYY